MTKAIVLVAHALLGWAACGATIALGRQAFEMRTTLVIHAVVAPAVFGLLSWRYFRRHPGSSPLGTAIAMLGVVVGLDAFLVAPLFERSYAMFSSVLGTWIPFASIATTTYLVGRATSPT